MGRRNWPLVGYFVLMFGLTLIGVVTASEKTICSASQLDKAAAQTNTIIFYCWEFWLNRYQTLLAALIALTAAAGSIYVVRRQMDQADRHEAERYAREGAAARAVLPLSLSAVCDYATKAGTALARILPTFRYGGVVRGLSNNFPDFPEGAIRQLENVIKTIPVEQGKALAEIISEIQVLDARVRGMIADARSSRTNILNYIINAIEIYARCSVNLDYARSKADNTQLIITTAEMKSACNAMRLFHSREELGIMIDQRERRYPAH